MKTAVEGVSMPAEEAPEKCCFKGCVRTGTPAQGYDFFACVECCQELERQIRARMTEQEYAAFDAYWKHRTAEEKS